MVITKILYIRVLLVAALLLSFTVSRLSAQSKFINGLELKDSSKIDPKKWQKEGDALKVAFGSTDVRYLRNQVPELKIRNEMKLTAWRGERVNIQIVIWAGSNISSISITPSDLTAPDKLIAAAVVKAFPVRYVLTDATPPASLVPDMLDHPGVFSMEGKSARPVWITIAVPAAAKPAIYQGAIEIKAQGGFKTRLSYTLDVQDRVLPNPSEWEYHLDLLQNPWAVARTAAVTPWTKEHVEALRSSLTMLAAAGQKSITTTLIYDPWNGQPFDHYESMVDWRKTADGSWTYDFALFDQWVELAMSCGISAQINCYSMIRRDNSYRYFDEKDNDYKSFTAVPGSPDFDEHWRSFLLAFREHLKNKGWLDKTYIAMEGCGLKELQATIKLIKTITPEIKITGVVVDHPEKAVAVFDLGAGIHSPLSENTLVGWSAAASTHKGFLTGGYQNWGKDPEHDARSGVGQAGNQYMVYPGARSSIRFERLREGIQDYEKIRILGEAFEKEGTVKAKHKLKLLDDMLDGITLKKVAGDSAAMIVNKGKWILNELSR